MALSSAKIVGASPHIDRPIGWKTYYVTPTLLTGAEVDCTVDTLPAGTFIIDARVVTIVAASGVSTVNIGVEIGATGAGDTALVADVANGGSTVGSINTIITPTAANLITINTVSLHLTNPQDLVVNAAIVYGGTETIAPTYAIMLLCGRNEY
jgi:hypothetical protein